MITFLDSWESAGIRTMRYDSVFGIDALNNPAFCQLQEQADTAG
jgi:hypothetical protein